MADGKIDQYTVYAHVTGTCAEWQGHYSVVYTDSTGKEHRIAVQRIPTSFATEDQAMNAARDAGEIAARDLRERNQVEPYRDDD